MALPTITNPRDTVALSDGVTVEVRGLTRGEAYELRALEDDEREFEVRLIAYGTDTPIDDARKWHASAPTGAVDPIVLAVSRLSGFTESDDGRPTETL